MKYCNHAGTKEDPCECEEDETRGSHGDIQGNKWFEKGATPVCCEHPSHTKNVSFC